MTLSMALKSITTALVLHILVRLHSTVRITNPLRVLFCLNTGKYGETDMPGRLGMKPRPTLDFPFQYSPPPSFHM
jgi:hypothetical protein